MFLRKLAPWAAGGAAIIAIALLSVNLVPEKNLANGAIQEHYGNKLVLPKGTASIRTLELYPDKRTPKFGVEDHSDGTTTHYHYRPDGTLERARVFGNAGDSARRPVIRESTMAADGKTYLTDVAYNLDGTVIRNVALLNDTTTTRRYFHNNGAIARDQIMSLDGKVWKLTSELAFREDGRKARVFTVTAGVSAVDTIYGDNQQVVALKTRDFKKDTYDEVWYAEDGKTELRVVKQTTSGTNVSVKRADGSTAQEVYWYGNIKDAWVIYVKEMDAKGRLTFQQNFSLSEGEQRLRSVEFYTAGIRKRLILFRTTGPENGNVEIETRFEGNTGNFGEPHTQWFYRKEGSLEAKRHYSKGSELVSETLYTESQNLRATVDPDWTKNRMVSEVPPQVIPYVPERD